MVCPEDPTGALVGGQCAKPPVNYREATPRSTWSTIPSPIRVAKPEGSHGAQVRVHSRL